MKAHHPMNPNEETASSLTGAARTDALHALRVLSEAAEPPVAADDPETPPLPAHLREQWLETYGESAAAPAAVITTSAGAARGGESWFTRLAGFFTKPRMAWGSGFAAAAVAAAAVVVLLTHKDGTIPDGPGDGGRGPTIRGVGGSVEGAARLILVAPADKAAPLMQELTRAYPTRGLERVDTVPADPEPGAVIIDATSGSIRRGAASFELKAGTDLFSTPADVIITAIESLDEPEQR